MQPPPHARAPAGLLLVAEDNPVNALVLSQQLSTLGYGCALARDGEQAWKMLGTQPYLALLTDCEMPVLDGYDLTRRIRMTAAAGQRRLPIVALSTRSTAIQEARSVAAGMDACLPKPTNASELAQTLTPLIAIPDSRVAQAAQARLTTLLATYSTPSLASVLDAFVPSAHADLLSLDELYVPDAPGPFGKLLHRLTGSLLLLAEPALATELDRWYREAMVPPPMQYARARWQVSEVIEQAHQALQMLRGY
jgi:CheY-like chemotaxis protein